MTATNTYFAANGWFTFQMLRQLSLVDHSLIADAFCPVVQQIEKDSAAGMLPRSVPEVAAYYGPLLTARGAPLGHIKMSPPRMAIKQG